jgi:hypothetical protein
MPTWASLGWHNQPIFLKAIRHISSFTSLGIKYTS